MAVMIIFMEFDLINRLSGQSCDTVKATAHATMSRNWDNRDALPRTPWSFRIHIQTYKGHLSSDLFNLDAKVDNPVWAGASIALLYDLQKKCN